MTDINKNSLQDEELSDFADHVIEGQMKNTVADSNEELRGLEETILRLHGNMPSTSLEDSTKKQMLVRLNARIRREKEETKAKPVWAFLTLSRSQFTIAIGIIAVLIITMIIAPSLTGFGGSSTTTGTALNSNSNIFIAIGLVGLIIGILWSMRRK